MIQIKAYYIEPQHDSSTLYFEETTGENCENGYGGGNPEITDVIGTEFILKRNDGVLFRADIGYRKYLGQVALPASAFVRVDDSEESECSDCSQSSPYESEMTYFPSGCWQITYRVYKQPFGNESPLIGQDTQALLLLEDVNTKTAHAVLQLVTKKCDEEKYMTTRTLRMNQLSDAVKSFALLESMDQQEWDCATVSANIEQIYNFLQIQP